jgi:hypothetical protein
MPAASAYNQYVQINADKYTPLSRGRWLRAA